MPKLPIKKADTSAAKKAEKPPKREEPAPVEVVESAPTDAVPVNAETPTPGTSVVKRREFGQSSLVGPTAVVQVSAPNTGSIPWLIFYSGRKKRAADIKSQIKTIAEGHAFVDLPADEDGERTYIPVAELFLLDAMEFTVLSKMFGEDIRPIAAWDRGDTSAEKKAKPAIVAVCLARTINGLIPCLAVFEGTKSGVGRTMAAAVHENGDWRTVIGVLMYTSGTGKESGFPYVVADVSPRPIDTEIAKELKAFFDDEDNADRGRAVQDAWYAKCAEYSALVAATRVAATPK